MFNIPRGSTVWHLRVAVRLQIGPLASPGPQSATSFRLPGVSAHFGILKTSKVAERLKEVCYLKTRISSWILVH